MEKFKTFELTEHHIFSCCLVKNVFRHDADDSKVLAEYVNVRMCELKGGHNYKPQFFFSIFIEHIVALHK